MTVFNSRTASTRDDWMTPIYIIKAVGEFDLDPCPNQDNLTRCALHGITRQEGGLAVPWIGRVWLNPPYGTSLKIWIAKLSRHGNGIALIPPRMGTPWFQEYVLDRADACFFLRGRVSFLNPDDGCAVHGNSADSVLVAYGQNNVEALRNCKLPGRLWEIKRD